MSSFDSISAIPIKDILDLLKIQYISDSSCLHLMENKRLTDGWKANLPGNYVNDFSGKGRAIGSSYTFVKSYLRLSDKETFKRFEDNFSVSNTGRSSKLKQKINKKERKKLVYSRNW